MCYNKVIRDLLATNERICHNVGTTPIDHVRLEHFQDRRHNNLNRLRELTDSENRPVVLFQRIQTVLVAMPANRIQPRTWFVELRLSARDLPYDADVRSCIKDILDLSNNFRVIRGLQHVSFAYSFRDPTRPDLAGIQDRSMVVDVIGFAHSHESILDTTMHSWIHDSRVTDQRWSPVSVPPGSSWIQTDIIKNFFSECESGRRVRVDWLWTGDASGSINKGGRPKRRHRGPDTPAADIPLTPLPPASLTPSLPVIFSIRFSPVISNPGNWRTILSLKIVFASFASRPTLILIPHRARTGGSWLLEIQRQATTLRVRLLLERVSCYLQSTHIQ